MSDERYCSNCRAALPADATTCAECGWWSSGGAAGFSPPNKEERPGGLKAAAPQVRRKGRIDDAEANRLVRQHLVATAGIQNDCIALLGHGCSGGAYLVSAVNRCDDIRLGKWRVDAKSGDVARAK